MYLNYFKKCHITDISFIYNVNFVSCQQNIDYYMALV